MCLHEWVSMEQLWCWGGQPCGFSRESSCTGHWHGHILLWAPLLLLLSPGSASSFSYHSSALPQLRSAITALLCSSPLLLPGGCSSPGGGIPWAQERDVTPAVGMGMCHTTELTLSHCPTARQVSRIQLSWTSLARTACRS